MFYRAWAFNQPLSLDTSSVTKMNGMFLYASAFNQPLSLDTSRGTDMADMFYARSSRAPLPPQPAQFAATLAIRDCPPHLPRLLSRPPARFRTR